MGSFRKDDRVAHPRHGAGVIMEVDGRYTVVEFDNDGVRKFITDVVQLERSDLPRPVKPVPAPRRRAPMRARVAATEHEEA